MSPSNRIRSSSQHKSYYTHCEVTYYRFRRVEAPSAPRLSVIPLPPDEYETIPIRQETQTKLEPPSRPRRHSMTQAIKPPATQRRHSHGDALPEPPQTKRRRVHFAADPTVINPNPSPLPEHSRAAARSAGVATSATTHCEPAPPAVPLKSNPPVRLHDLLSSFPAKLWDVRRHASPLYDPYYEPIYWEPVFPSALSLTALRLVFSPCARTELSWFARVQSARNQLVVGDVLRAVSTELFARTACRELYSDHPCFAEACAAHQLRVQRGLTEVPCYADGMRNVDLYHVNKGGKGEKGTEEGGLWFRGLREEVLRDGEVVYRVMFGWA